jgi:hypothetical protein
MAGKVLSRVAWFVGGFASAFVLMAVVCRYPPSFGEERFNAIREGMTKRELVALVGCPPGDYRPAIWRYPDWYTSTHEPIGSLVKKSGQSMPQVQELERQEIKEWLDEAREKGKIRWGRRMEQMVWTGRSSQIMVVFDKDEKIIHRSLWSMDPPRPPHDLVRYAQWWLGW